MALWIIKQKQNPMKSIYDSTNQYNQYKIDWISLATKLENVP